VCLLKLKEPAGEKSHYTPPLRYDSGSEQQRIDISIHWREKWKIREIITLLRSIGGRIQFKGI
jgi:hypothetical protein